MALAAALLTLPAAAQLPPASPPAVHAGCADSLTVAGEGYDFSGGARGHGASIDAQFCTAGAWRWLAGASAYDVIDSRWNLGRAGATLRWPAGHVAHAVANVGGGRNAGGDFDYRKVSGGLTFKATEAIFARVEHEYFDVDKNRGNIGKLGVVAIVAEGVTLDVGFARSIDGNLPTRAVTVRLDAQAGPARLFTGLSHGRLLPQVQDIASAERAPDVVSREMFGGAAVRLPVGELIVAFDNARTGESRRTTFSIALQVPLP